MNYFDAVKYGLGSLAGSVGGLIQGVTGQTSSGSNWLRDIGGQLTGGTRNYNLVPNTPTMTNVTQANLLSPVPDGQVKGISAQDMSSEWINNPTDNTGDKTGGTPPGGGTPTGDGGQNTIDTLKREYINTLNNMYSQMGNEIESQKGSQEGMIQNSYDQSLKNIDTSTQQNKGEVLGQQSKTLKELADNIANQYYAGNQFLGARGAGDSSAANMYSYALNKMGTKSRGDILAQTNAQLAKINNLALQEKTKLDSEKTNNMLLVANWYSQAKQQLAGYKGQDLASLSKTLLENAISALSATKTNYEAKVAALQEWAMNNSTNVSQLQTNLKNVASIAPSFAGIAGTPQVSSNGYYYLPGNNQQVSNDDWLKKLTSINT